MAEEIWDAGQINETMAQLSKQIFPPGVRFYYAEVDELQEQGLNAQSMPQSMFEQLVHNIAEAGLLESVPLCVRVDGRIYIISGHHRVRAARAAKVTHITVLLYEELDESRVKAKQLAHNSIAGQSDPQLVKRIWEQIRDVQARFEAFIDPRLFKDIPKPVKFKPADVDMKALQKSVLVVFLSSQKVDFDRALAALPSTEVDQVYLAARETYDAWREALQRVREEMDIIAIPTAMAEMARLAMQALEAQKVGGNGSG